MQQIKQYIKPREFMEPIHPDAPGFNPDKHRDLVEEVNEVLGSVVTRYMVGPEDASEEEYDYRQRGDEIEFYDRQLGIWRTLSRATRYNPAYRTKATVKNTYGYAFRGRIVAHVETDTALLNGEDIKVYAYAPEGALEEIPRKIQSIDTSGEKPIYTVYWVGDIKQGEQDFYISWGDETASESKFTISEVDDFYKFIDNGFFGLEPLGDYYSVRVGECREEDYPTDFGNGGIVIFESRDDNGSFHTLPDNTYAVWKGIKYHQGRSELKTAQ